MIKFNNFKVFGFVIVLIGAIAFALINFLEAKKARPGESWKKRISGCGECSSSRVNSENVLSPSNTCYWVKTYGCSKNGDVENWEPHNWYFSIRQTRDGGYILADAIHPSDDIEGYSDIWVLKLDAEGVVDWHRCYGGDLIERFPTIDTTDDGGYIVLSKIYSLDYEELNIWIFKLDSKGNIEWQKIFGGDVTDEASSIQQTRDGGYIVGGFTTSFGPPGILILKLGSTGNIEWQRLYHAGADMVGIRQTSDGGYILVSAVNIDGNWEAWVLKLDANGYSEWQRAYGGPENDSGWFTIQETNDGGYIVNCRTDSFCPTSAIWILKLTRKGDIEWQKTYDGFSTDWGNSIQQTTDGGYLYGGGTISFGAGLADILLLKLNPYGAIQWQRTYGAGQGDITMSVPQTEDGGYIIGGWSQSFSNRLFILKLPPDGDIGGFCALTDIPNMISSDTFVTPRKTNVTPINSTLVSYNTNVQPEEINAFEELVCWNLNQAPVNVSLEREINRSVFTREAFHIISWSPNPANDQFNITQYKIYRADMGSERYELLGVVSGDAFEYIDGYLELDAKFDYIITSIDSEGNESPKSSAVTGG